MLQTALFSLVALVLARARAVQVPLRLDGYSEHPTPTEWKLDEIANPNSTDHLVFNTVYSLLQHWPNLYMPNGHTIVPGIIPKGTLLYHYTNQNELPLVPEWVALDPEFAYCYCGGKQECWYLTLVITRPLQIVYFDGHSAGKSSNGVLDTQDLLVWGESRPENVFEESRRINDLCEWGKKFGVGGILRMGRSFEVMLCDFASGISLVSSTDIVHTQGAVVPRRVLFETLYSGSWHNNFPGETRIQLDLARLVSFYDTQLVPSLVPVRATQERWEYRVRDVSSQDLLAVKSRLETVLTRPWGSATGIDWRTLVQVIVDRFAGRLELARHLLNASVADPNTRLDLANKTQTQLRIMLAPYLVLSARPADPSDRTDLDWTEPVFKRCATTHTHFMASELDPLTGSERLILQAARGTSWEICRVVTKMWAAGVYAGVDSSINTKDDPDMVELAHVWRGWTEDLDHLMAWLDWSMWVKCNPECGPEELCSLYGWPIELPVRFPTGSNLQDVGMESVAEEVGTRPEWQQPRCISRVDP